jgi:protein TonB
MKNMKYLSLLPLIIAFSGYAQTTATAEVPKTEIYTIVEVPAEFPGGSAAMVKFIQDNLVYPERAKKAKIGGKCFLKFVVNKQGGIEQVEVLKGVNDCSECDEEAKRVIKIMPQWIPAKMNAGPVPSYFNLPLNFKP